MSALRRFKMDGLAWSLRRLHCPVKKNDLVLEVGSGGNPYFRSNVLCDAYLETRERHFVPLVSDRPTILSFTEQLPFQDNVFDFCIASHVLEHSKDPARFISEIQRVSRAGYIESPDAFFERLTGYLDHRLEITCKNNELVIRKKKGRFEDPEIIDLFFGNADAVFASWVSKHPFHFHVRFYWEKTKGGIKYRIVNPQYEFNWECPMAEPAAPKRETFKMRIRTLGIKRLRKLLSQTKRNKKLDVTKFLQCPFCAGTTFSRASKALICNSCNKDFIIMSDNIYNFVR